MDLWLIRQAEKWEIPRCAELVMLSDTGVLELITFRSRKRLEMLMEGENYKDSVFSYKNILVAERGGEIVGVLFGYDRAVNAAANFSTLKQIRRLIGWARFLWLFPGLLILGVQASFAKGDFYVSNVAVDPEVRGSGIGASFFLHLEETKYKNIVLDVVRENTGAIRFYERLGYRIKRSWWFLGKKYLRMAKSLK